LRVVKYHGSGRSREPEKLAESDIVLTTYHTLLSDATRFESSIYQIRWYRVVLDEGKLNISDVAGFRRQGPDIDDYVLQRMSFDINLRNSFERS
jgi:hypothetical protein